MKFQNILSVLALPLLLGGCGIYTTYHRPDGLSTDSLLRPDTSSVVSSSLASADTVSAHGADSLSSLSWRQLFTDPQLVSLIEEGLKNNADVQTARLKVEEAAASLHASKAANLPSLSLGADGKLSSFDGSSPSKTYNLGASASWEADAFGSLRNQRKESAATLGYTQAYAQAVQTQLIATIAEDYYTLLLLDRKLQITAETVQTWQEYVQTIKALMEAGQETEVAVAQNEASLLGAQAQQIALRQQIAVQENALSVLVGSAPRAISRSSLDKADFSAVTASGISVSALANRPDVRQAECQLEKAFYATNTARSAFYPSLTLSGTLGWTNNSGVAIVNPGKMLWTAMGSLTQPLLNNGRNKANLRIAQAQQQEAKLSFQQALLNAGQEVNNALLQCQTAKVAQTIEAQQVDKLQTALGNTKLLMENGTSNYLEVLTVRQSLLSAQLSLASDKYNEVEAAILLYHAVGGGSK